MFAKKIKTIVSIEGMSCGHCISSVTKALESLDNVKKVSVSLSKKEASIVSTEKLKKEDITKVIDELDFKVIDIIEK
ncbi:MAG: heavy-metal-associated domain-containing protein [Erysipelotrichales bacterium]|nr:heavy-metal-associated domain-containing protein [Erysipelotrichales bacterium]